MKALLGIWRDSKIQDGAVRNKIVYEKIAQKINEQGHTRDWKQCRSKVKNLKTRYREVKDHNNRTGNGRKVCKFYSELDSILAHRPSSAPTVISIPTKAFTFSTVTSDHGLACSLTFCRHLAAYRLVSVTNNAHTSSVK